MCIAGRYINVTCQCRLEAYKRKEVEREINTIERHLRYSGFETGRYAEMRMENWQGSQQTKRIEQNVYEYIAQATGKGRNWLYLCGNYGSGKTHLAVAAARQLAFDRKLKPEIIRWAEHCSQIQASWKKENEQQIKWGQMHRAQLLVIDDLDKRQATEWAIGQLFELIENRNVYRRPTIITANRRIADLAQVWEYDQRIADTGKAIISRIVGNLFAQIEFTGSDYRMKPERSRQ